MKVSVRFLRGLCGGVLASAFAWRAFGADNSVALEALSRLKGMDLEANPALKAAVLKVLNEVKGTAQFVEIVRDFKITGQEPALLDLGTKDPSSSAGVDAMRLVLHGADSQLLNTALAGTNAAKVVEGLGNTHEKEIVPLLEPLVTDNSREPVVRRQAVRALAKVQEGATALLRLAEQQKLPEDVKLTASSELNLARWPEVKSEAKRLLPLPQTQNAQPLPPITELIQMKGDPMKGAGVFRRETGECIKCHQVNGEGVDFGPNLSEIGTKLGKEALFESILDPSAGISFGFEAWQIDLKNGDEAFGLITNETADEIAIKAVGGVVTRHKKSEIGKRTQQKLSIMPAGLQQAMSTQDLVDLVEYLTTLQKAAVPAK